MALELEAMFDEKLSSLMDGEMSDREVDELLERASTDAQLRAAWSRLHLASTTLHESTALAYVDAGFADRVMSALDAHDTDAPGRARKVVPLAASRRRHKRGQRRWYGPVAGLAVAASVAAVAVLVLDQPGPMAPQAPGGAVTATAPDAAQSPLPARTVAVGDSANAGGNADQQGLGDSAASAPAPGFDNLFRVVASQRWARRFEQTALNFPSDGNVSVSSGTRAKLDMTEAARRQALEGVWLNHNSYPNDTGLSSMMGYMHLTAQESAPAPGGQ